MEQILELADDQGELMKDPNIYRKLFGRLIYLTITRPDVTYSVNHLSQFMHPLREPHLNVAL